MADTTCPGCDAPAAAGSQRCSRCGYRFLEDGGGPPRRVPRPSRFVVAVAALMVAAVAAVVWLGGRGADQAERPEPVTSHLDMLSRHPLQNPDAERMLEERFLGVRRFDESAFVHCSARVPEPAHSVRRCRVSYPGGGTLTVVLITTANGAEVISEP